MQKAFRWPRWIMAWQVLFLLFSSSWLFAPQLNHLLSYRTTLISQYESSGQPHALLLRLCDLLGGLLLVWMAAFFIRRLKSKRFGWLLLVGGLGMALDPLLTTTCKASVGDVSQCIEYYSSSFLLHAIETVTTASAFFILGVYDAWARKKVVSIGFAAFQVAYFILFISQFATHARYNTFSQFVYQLTLVVWTAWFVRDLLVDEMGRRLSYRDKLIKYAVAGWATLNGILAILISFSDISVVGKLHGLYFAGDNAWLAQHSVVVGVILLYLSRHLARGERRARQIFLIIAGLETLKYSLITPHSGLLIIYLVTFCLLFVWRDIFDRGTVPLTWQIKTRDLVYMVVGLLTAVAISLIMLDRDNRVSIITSRSLDHFFDYTLTSRIFPKGHLPSILLAHTAVAFLLVSALALLWIMFRPAKVTGGDRNYSRIKQLLQQYSGSSEDFFKLWPEDKNYFWNQGFIAYKAVGPVVFALADPVAKVSDKPLLIDEFINWSRSRRLRACFLPIYKDSLALYESAGLATMQIGASAVIDCQTFLQKTQNDKWWRWQKNRAEKSHYSYNTASPPHSAKFLHQLKKVSNAWLADGGHKERGFALGYFNGDYLQKCTIHFLTDAADDIVAFTNQLPQFKPSPTASIDLLRYRPSANNSMPYLLSKTIEAVQAEKGIQYFDLGFVPFAALNNPAVQVAKTLSAGRFSSKGLEQFKNKFDPEWQPNYLAYDGDMADLVLIALNLERAMDLE